MRAQGRGALLSAMVLSVQGELYEEPPKQQDAQNDDQSNYDDLDQAHGRIPRC